MVSKYKHFLDRLIEVILCLCLQDQRSQINILFMSLEVIPFSEIPDIHQAAIEISGSLMQPENRDIALEFPDTVERYTGDIYKVIENLQQTELSCQKSVREQFLTFFDGRVVGMYVIRLVSDLPEGIENDSPNLSGYIVRPWRGIGIASLILERQLGTVNSNFGGKAYTQIRKNNLPSLKLAYRYGFKELDSIQRSDKIVLTYKDLTPLV